MICTCFSRILDKTHRIFIGLYLPFLKIKQTLSIFHGVGNCDEPILRLITFTMAVAIAGAIIQSIFYDNPSVPSAFLGSTFWSSFNAKTFSIAGKSNTASGGILESTKALSLSYLGAGRLSSLR